MADKNYKLTFEMGDGSVQEVQFAVPQGEPGKDGVAGKDGYTPVKGVDYFDGQDGKDGIDGKDGQNGKDGTSVTVSSVTESTEDGGTNVVKFSDGKTLNVRNGKAGSNGKDGYTPVKGIDYFDGQDGEPGKDGYTPIKGVDYFDGKDGKDGEPGQDGKDGVTPVFSIGTVETLEPGTDASASITGTAENPVLNLGIPKGMPGEGGSGGGAAIVDVTELPTENINEDVFYRVMTASFLYGQYIKNEWTMYTVETLPQTGEMCWDGTTAVAYFSVADNDTFGYVDTNVSAAMGVPVGWYPASVLIPAVGEQYGGVVTDLTQAAEDTVYTFLQHVLHSYKDGVWSKVDVIGWRGTGQSAEVFNHLSNVALGSYSHAEGYGTTASGDYSHAEGYGTTASVDYSHAEGSETTASGFCSHAEGYGTTASVDYSHAEGYRTTASGFYSHAEGSETTASGSDSHAEGRGTIAASDYQHVQGRYNIEDANRTYLHIVGNGKNADERSNAHTLDSQGHAWFSGSVACDGLRLWSPAGYLFVVNVNDDGELVVSRI